MSRAGPLYVAARQRAAGACRVERSMKHLVRALLIVVTCLHASMGRAQTDSSVGVEAVAPVRIDPELFEEALRRYAGEPTVRFTVHAALLRSRQGAMSARAAAGRARASGWVPEVEFGVRRDFAQDSSQLVAEDDKLRYSSGNELSLDGSLTFHLERVVFASEEVSLLREDRARIEAENALVSQVVHLYFERRRLEIERDYLGASDLQTLMRIQEVGAELDELTGGAFTRRLWVGSRRDQR